MSKHTHRRFEFALVSNMSARFKTMQHSSVNLVSNDAEFESIPQDKGTVSANFDQLRVALTTLVFVILDVRFLCLCVCLCACVCLCVLGK